MKKKLSIIAVFASVACLLLVLAACDPNPKSLATPPKYIGFSFEEPSTPVVPASHSINTAGKIVLPMEEETGTVFEIKPDNDLNIVLLYENEKRDMIVDVVVNDSLKGTNQVYSATSQNNQITSIETVYSEERDTWITEVTLLVKSHNQPVNDRTIEVKETSFIRDLVNESVTGIAAIDSEAETVATYTVLSKLNIAGEVLYGRVGAKIDIEDPSTGGREFVGFYYYENSTRVNYTAGSDGKYEFLNKPTDLQIEWENLPYKIEYFVDGIKHGETESYIFTGENNLLKQVEVAGRVPGTGNWGDYFDGWYLDSSLIGSKLTDENSIADLISKSDTEVVIKLYGQVVHAFFNPEVGIFSYNSAQKYGYEGYAIAFDYDVLLDKANQLFPYRLTIPAIVNGMKIDVIEGFNSFWSKPGANSQTRLTMHLTISDGIKLIIENSLRAAYSPVAGSITLPEDIIIDDPNFGNW